jgi:hypothetical protein
MSFETMVSFTAEEESQSSASILLKKMVVLRVKETAKSSNKNAKNWTLHLCGRCCESIIIIEKKETGNLQVPGRLAGLKINQAQVQVYY